MGVGVGGDDAGEVEEMGDGKACLAFTGAMVVWFMDGLLQQMCGWKMVRPIMAL